MTKLPTNTNIMDAVVSLTKEFAKNQATQDIRHEDTTKRLADIDDRLKYTNGNVKDLLLWQSNMKAVDDYKKEQEAQSGSNLKAGFDWTKWMAYLVALAAALIAIGQKLA